jgi:hypothetical protein
VTWQPPEPLFKLQQRVSELMLDGQRDYADALMREACLAPPYGLWVLLRYGLGRTDAHNQWVFDRCLEVQASPDGHLDLWAREHYKSTIITFALSIQDILAILRRPSASSATRGRSPRRSSARSSRSSSATTG